MSAAVLGLDADEEVPAGNGEVQLLVVPVLVGRPVAELVAEAHPARRAALELPLPVLEVVGVVGRRARDHPGPIRALVLLKYEHRIKMINES